MIIKFKKDDIKQLLKLYYKEYEGIECNITFKTEIGYKGYYETETCIVTINQITELELLGKKHKTVNVLTEDDVKTALDAILKEKGLKVKNIIINKDIEEVWGGYGPFEQCDYKPVFNGIDIEAEQLEKGKQITLGRMMNNGNIPRQR